MQPAVLEKLRSIVGAPHVLTGVDLSPYVVEGRTPEAAVFPGTVDEVRAVVTLAAESEIPVIAWGGGTAAAAGVAAARAGLVLGLTRLDRVVEHEPGDLTATVEAGRTVAALQATLRERGQWLSLDPPDETRATIGGVFAANASGPRRQLYGTARDLLIGLTVVTAEGAVVRGGGKVVKNVAGYDLPKLFVGSYGTLGIIVECTVKLRPRPDDERLVAVSFDRMKDAGATVRALMASDLIPNAIELLDGASLRALTASAPPAPGAGASAALLVGFDGVPDQVAWQVSELGRLVAATGGRDVREVPAETWPRLARAAAAAFPACAVMRLSVLPTQVADAMEQGGELARGRGMASAWSAHAGVGVVTASLALADGRQDLGVVAAVLREWRGIARGCSGFAVLDTAPLAVKEAVGVWDDAGAAGRIMRRIKEELDPKNVLNPGRFVDSI
ncbi:MAG: FAD-binding oxidoreductase [Candidatus Rokubacteria bacterium]|nr:FAD-binding oxidoreductase [Candidatus Rokubacteria bacterium]